MTKFANYLLSAIEYYKGFLRKLGQTFNIDLTCLLLDYADDPDISPEVSSKIYSCTYGTTDHYSLSSKYSR